MRSPARGPAREISLTNGVEPEANQAAISCDPQILIIHREIVHRPREVTLAKRTKRWGVKAHVPYPPIPDHPETRPFGYKPAEPAQKRRQIGPERPCPAPRIAPEQGITGEGHDRIG